MPEKWRSRHSGYGRSFEVQVWGNTEDGFTAYLPSVDRQVWAPTFHEAEREAVQLARALEPSRGEHHESTF